MTDVSTTTGSSSSTLIAPSIPIGPNIKGPAKRELNDACKDDEAPEKAQKIMSTCIGQGAADKLGGLNAAEYKEDLGKWRRSTEIEIRLESTLCISEAEIRVIGISRP